MTDVFLSYARRDRTRVAAVVERLRAAGLAVWWDVDIPPGAPWETTIERALAEAGAVVVFWSATSVESENVRSEARRARTQDRLVQVFFDGCEPPLFFGERQGIEMTAAGGQGDAAIERLIAAVRDRLSGTGSIATSPSSTERAPMPPRRSVLIGGAAAAASLAGGVLLWQRGHDGDTDPSIAVMPFANLSGDPAQAYFSDGIAEELRGALARLPHLKVIGRTSSEKLRDEAATDAARKLNVANILTGSVRRSAILIRISAQLIDGDSGVERWSQSYDRPLGDTLAIQSGIAESVARELSIALGIAQKAAIIVGGTSDPVANDLYLQAYKLAVTRGDEDSTRHSLALLERALALDPRYADATAARASLLGFFAANFAPSALARQAGLAEAELVGKHAIALAPSFARAYATLATVRVYQLQLRSALALYAQAAKMGQHAAWLIHLFNYANLLGKLGHGDAAARVSAIIATIDPLNPLGSSIKASLLFYRRRYPEALVTSRHALQSRPNETGSLFRTSQILALMGRPRDALATIGHLPADGGARLSMTAIIAERLGDRAASDRALHRLKLLSADASDFQYAEIYAQQGKVDLALAALADAIRTRDPGLSDLPTDPFLDPLRGDTRFKRIVAQLDFS